MKVAYVYMLMLDCWFLGSSVKRNTCQTYVRPAPSNFFLRPYECLVESSGLLAGVISFGFWWLRLLPQTRALGCKKCENMEETSMSAGNRRGREGLRTSADRDQLVHQT